MKLALQARRAVLVSESEVDPVPVRIDDRWDVYFLREDQADALSSGIRTNGRDVLGTLGLPIRSSNTEFYELFVRAFQGRAIGLVAFLGEPDDRGLAMLLRPVVGAGWHNGTEGSLLPLVVPYGAAQNCSIILSALTPQAFLATCRSLGMEWSGFEADFAAEHPDQCSGLGRRVIPLLRAYPNAPFVYRHLLQWLRAIWTVTGEEIFRTQRFNGKDFQFLTRSHALVRNAGKPLHWVRKSLEM